MDVKTVSAPTQGVGSLGYYGLEDKGVGSLRCHGCEDFVCSDQGGGIF